MIIHDMPDTEYHARSELSSTGARLLLDSPAKFAYAQTHKQAPKAAYDLGTAAHTKVLGVGSGLVAYPPEHLTPSDKVSTKKETIAWAAEQRDAGLTPVTPNEIAAVDAMVESILANREARELLEQAGNSEATVITKDMDTGVDMRARFDFLPNFTQNDPIAVDLKTSRKSASADQFTRTVAEFGYHIQQEWYLHAYGLETGDYTMRMKFIILETAAPYLVAVHELSEGYAQIARHEVHRALDTYRTCTDADLWPGYPQNMPPLEPPMWLVYQNEEEIELKL